MDAVSDVFLHPVPLLVVLVGTEVAHCASWVRLLKNRLESQGREVELAGPWGFSHTLQRLFGSRALGPSEISVLLDSVAPESRWNFMCVAWSESIANAHKRLQEKLWRTVPRIESASQAAESRTGTAQLRQVVLVDGFWYKAAVDDLNKIGSKRTYADLELFEKSLPEPDAIFALTSHVTMPLPQESGAITLQRMAKERGWFKVACDDEPLQHGLVGTQVCADDLTWAPFSLLWDQLQQVLANQDKAHFPEHKSQMGEFENIRSDSEWNGSKWTQVEGPAVTY